MGRVDKGIHCSVEACENEALRSISSNKAHMAPGMDMDSSVGKRIFLCKQHYKDWKKATKEDRDNERARWG